MSMSPLRRLVGPVGVVLATALLSGCGETNPGVAVQVGAESISVNRVDELAGEYCRAIEDQLATNGQTVPNRYFRGGIAGTLTMRSIAEQLAEDYAVEPGSVYDEKVAQLEQSVSVLEEDVREAVLEVESSAAYVEAVQAAVGDRLLEEDGVYAAEYSARVERGRAAFEDWISAHDVTFDPQLGIELAQGRIAPVDTSLSHPVGDAATAGAAEEPDPAYAKSLPDAHRCG